MFSSSREERGLMPVAYPLVAAPPELQFSASVFLNSSFSFLGHSLFGSRPRGMKDSSSVSKVTALVDSGADVHILSYEDALTMFLDVSSLMPLPFHCIIVPFAQGSAQVYGFWCFSAQLYSTMFFADREFL